MAWLPTSEVLVQFDEPQRSPDGRSFVAQVHGRRRGDGVWEGWLEFHPLDGGDPVVTGRATEQLTRGDLRFWAAGISRDELAVALLRALAQRPRPASASLGLPGAADAPDVTDVSTILDSGTAAPADGEPVLDPYLLLSTRGEYALRQALRGLNAAALRAIIETYRIPALDVVDLARTFEDALAERIVAGAQHRVGGAPAGRARELRRATK